MDKGKTYKHRLFDVQVIDQALEEFQELARLSAEELPPEEPYKELPEGLPADLVEQFSGKVRFSYPRLMVQRATESWTFDNYDELRAEYRRRPWDLFLLTIEAEIYAASGDKLDVNKLSVGCLGTTETRVVVSGSSRGKIERIFEVFEKGLATAENARPQPPAEKAPEPPVVFIGHGRDQAWKDLRDHLVDKHGFQVEAYESEERAAYPVVETLRKMLSRASIGLFVMTGEDETAERQVRARQNVVHELGLFQGKRGFRRGVMLVEDGVEGFSNLSGVQQIRFQKGRIESCFGDVLATLRREFPGT